MAREAYELWDVTTGNCVGSYRTEAAALADVVDDFERNGQQAFDLALGGPAIEGSISGKALVDKALAWQKKTA